MPGKGGIVYIYCSNCDEDTPHTVEPVAKNKERRRCTRCRQAKDS